jgi:hypothetical protein
MTNLDIFDIKTAYMACDKLEDAINELDTIAIFAHNLYSIPEYKWLKNATGCKLISDEDGHINVEGFGKYSLINSKEEI